MSFVSGSIAETNGYEASGENEGESPFLGGSLAGSPGVRDGAGSPPAGPAGELDVSPEPEAEAESPFLAGEALAADGGVAGDLHQLLAELYDSEFDQALQELADSAVAAAGDSPMASGPGYSPEAESYVRDWLEPLQRDAHAMLEAIGESLAEHDLAQLSEYELDELLDRHEPVVSGANPVFENFLGGLWKKVKGVVSGAAKLARQGVSALGKLLPIGRILDGLKSLVRPLVERVLQMALDRLPPALRPAAEALKKRLFGEAEYEDSEAAVSGPVATVADVSEVQQEFDVNAASLLFAADQNEQDAMVAEAWEATAQDEDPINDLAAARERFEAELQSLPPGADPQPAIEGFLPAVMAVMPLLRMGISLIGRDRIIRHIAQFVAPLIQPYIGDQAPALAQAIASTGLSMMSLEAPTDPAAVSASVLAGTVEDTARRVAELADEALEHPDLLEATTAAAFDEAAAAHFPPAMIKPSRRPVHLGPHHVRRHHRAHQPPGDDHGWQHPGSGMWIRLPRHHVYRKYTKLLTAHITPTIAKQVHVFGGATLESFLRDRYGITGEITAPVHVYEARQGATLGRIAAFETRTRGLGHSSEAWKLQPLTPEIAGMLVGEPGLGSAVGPEFLAGPRKITVGQRFYYLELDGRAAHHDAPPRPAAASEISSGAGRSSEVNVRVDVRGHVIRVALYLSEADAQETAGLIRAHGPSAVSKLLYERLHRGLKLALSAHPLGHLRWIEPTAAAAPLPSPSVAPPALADHQHARRLVHRVLRWSAPAMFDFIARDPRLFTAAAERRAHGVTLIAERRGVRPEHHGHAPAVVEVVAGFRRA